MKKISSSFYKDLVELRPQEKNGFTSLGEETFEVKNQRLPNPRRKDQNV